MGRLRCVCQWVRAVCRLPRCKIICRGVVYSLLLLGLQVFVWTVTLSSPSKESRNEAAEGEKPVYVMTERSTTTQPADADVVYKWSLQETHIRLNLTTRYRPKPVQFYGKPRSKKGFLTIGVPSISRPGVASTYLRQTISSLLNKMAPSYMDSVTILIYVADFDKAFQTQVVHYITSSYRTEMERGIILIVLADPSNYPPLLGIQRNYNDSVERVKWRSKQVVDFAFMFHYGQNLSQYYMQIEDDVIAAKGYVQKIKDFIEEQDKPWITLQFSLLGFIGKLYRSSELPLFYDFLMLFYDQMPVDWLYEYFAKIMARPEMPLRMPTLFQHKGVKSSFHAKEDVKLYDGYFEDDLIPKKKGDNPPGKCCTNIKQYGKKTPQFVYNRTWPFDFYWGTNIEQDSQFSLIFDEPQNISEVEVISGHINRKDDVIKNAVLELGYQRYKAAPQNCTCDVYKTYSNFSLGAGKISYQDLHFSNPVVCVRVRFTEPQSNWVIFSNIIVHTLKTK